MDAKLLMQIAKVCRKMGITQLQTKDFQMAINLEHAEPKRSKAAIDDRPPQTESMSEEELLYWSSTPHSDN